MGIKTIKVVSIVEVCPNQDKHTKERAIKAKSSPDDYFKCSFVRDTRKHHYCPECGARYILKQVKFTSEVCDSCGEPIFSSDVHCPNCGVQAR